MAEGRGPARRRGRGGRSVSSGGGRPAPFAGESEVVRRAKLSGGAGEEAVYRAVRAELEALGVGGGVAVDVGAGSGALWGHVRDRCREYWAVDAIAYGGLPGEARFVKADLNRPPVALPDGCADLVFAIEVIEHVENPRLLCRELARLAGPGAWIVVTTPNQVSLLSVLALALKQQFSSFTDASYPAHLTALLPVDLRRIAAELGLEEVRLAWTGDGRMPGTSLHWPRLLGRLSPRLFSDSVLLLARKPR